MATGARGRVARPPDISTKQPRPHAHNGNLLFFRLPAELRIRIYKLLVVRRRAIHLTSIISLGHSDERHILSRAAKQPALAYVCSQLYHEVSHTFYHYNVFKLHSIRSSGYGYRARSANAEKFVASWIAKLSEANQKALGSVRVCVDLCWALEVRETRRSNLYRCVDGLPIKYKYTKAPKTEWRASSVDLKGWYWELNVKPTNKCDHSSRVGNQAHVRHSLLVKKSS